MTTLKRRAALCAMTLTVAVTGALIVTSIGNAVGPLVGSSTIQSGVDSDSPGQAEAFTATAGTTGTFSTLHIYLDAGNTARTVQLGVYANNAGKPGTKLASCTVAATTAGAWNACTANGTVTSGTVYWLAVLQPAGTTGALRFRDSSSGTGYTSTQTTLTGLPASYSPGTRWPGSPASIYADTTGTPTPTPTPTPTTTPTPTPSPTPTPTATPTPPPTGTCFTSPGSCGFPDPAYGNVGVPAGTTLTPSGSLTVNTPGTVIDGLDVTGTIDVNATNVTIRNTRITLTSGGCTTACGNSLIHLSGPYDVTVSHVELTSLPGHTVEHAIRNTYGGVLHIDHAYQHGDVDALCHCGDATITDSYSTIYEAIPGDHLENMYVDNHTLDVERNTLINHEGQTANIFMDDGSGNHLTAKGNLFAGGGWAMAVCPKNGCSTATADIEGNTFTRCDHGNEVQGGGGTWVCANGADDYGLFPRSGDYGWDANMPSQTTWSGNVWDDNGTTVPL